MKNSTDLNRLHGTIAALRTVSERASAINNQSRRHLVETLREERKAFLLASKSSIAIRILFESADGFEEAFLEVIDEFIGNTNGTRAV